MKTAKPCTTVVSTKGQVVLPRAARERRRWNAGVRLLVEETPEGVVLKPAPVFAPTRSEDVFGSAGYRGPVRSVEEMHEGIAREARLRHDRGRY
jgi:AbrB family looped-hinge helix DNA binding protein